MIQETAKQGLQEGQPTLQPQLADNVDMFAAFASNPKQYRDFITSVPPDKLTMNYPKEDYQTAYKNAGFDPKTFDDFYTQLQSDYTALKQNTSPRTRTMTTSDIFGGAEKTGFMHYQPILGEASSNEVEMDVYGTAEKIRQRGPVYKKVKVYDDSLNESYVYKESTDMSNPVTRALKKIGTGLNMYQNMLEGVENDKLTKIVQSFKYDANDKPIYDQPIYLEVPVNSYTPNTDPMHVVNWGYQSKGIMEGLFNGVFGYTAARWTNIPLYIATIPKGISTALQSDETRVAIQDAWAKLPADAYEERTRLAQELMGPTAAAIDNVYNQSMALSEAFRADNYSEETKNKMGANGWYMFSSVPAFMGAVGSLAGMLKGQRDFAKLMPQSWASKSIQIAGREFSAASTAALAYGGVQAAQSNYEDYRQAYGDKRAGEMYGINLFMAAIAEGVVNTQGWLFKGIWDEGGQKAFSKGLKEEMEGYAVKGLTKGADHANAEVTKGAFKKMFSSEGFLYNTFSKPLNYLNKTEGWINAGWTEMKQETLEELGYYGVEQYFNTMDKDKYQTAYEGQELWKRLTENGIGGFVGGSMAHTMTRKSLAQDRLDYGKNAIVQELARKGGDIYNTINPIRQYYKDGNFPYSNLDSKGRPINDYAPANAANREEALKQGWTPVPAEKGDPLLTYDPEQKVVILKTMADVFYYGSVRKQEALIAAFVNSGTIDMQNGILKTMPDLMKRTFDNIMTIKEQEQLLTEAKTDKDKNVISKVIETLQKDNKYLIDDYMSSGYSQAVVEAITLTAMVQKNYDAKPEVLKNLNSRMSAIMKTRTDERSGLAQQSGQYYEGVGKKLEGLSKDNIDELEKTLSDIAGTSKKYGFVPTNVRKQLEGFRIPEDEAFGGNTQMFNIYNTLEGIINGTEETEAKYTAASDADITLNELLKLRNPDNGLYTWTLEDAIQALQTMDTVTGKSILNEMDYHIGMLGLLQDLFYNDTNVNIKELTVDTEGGYKYPTLKELYNTKEIVGDNDTLPYIPESVTKQLNDILNGTSDREGILGRYTQVKNDIVAKEASAEAAELHTEEASIRNRFEVIRIISTKGNELSFLKTKTTDASKKAHDYISTNLEFIGKNSVRHMNEAQRLLLVAEDSLSEDLSTNEDNKKKLLEFLVEGIKSYHPLFESNNRRSSKSLSQLTMKSSLPKKKVFENKLEEKDPNSIPKEIVIEEPTQAWTFGDLNSSIDVYTGSVLLVWINNYVNTLSSISPLYYQNLLDTEFGTKNFTSAQFTLGKEQEQTLGYILPLLTENVYDVVTPKNSSEEKYPFIYTNAWTDRRTLQEDIEPKHKGSLYLQASAGAGKTFLMKSIVLLNQKLKNSKVDSIIILSPSKRLSNDTKANMINGMSAEMQIVMNKITYMSHKEFESRQEAFDEKTLLIVDEGFKMTPNKLKHVFLKNARILFLGDDAQYKDDNSDTLIRKFSYPVHSLFRLYRTGVKVISDDLKAMHDAVLGGMKYISTIPALYDRERTKGLQYILDSEQVKKEYLKDITKKDANSRYIVFNTATEANDWYEANKEAMFNLRSNVYYVRGEELLPVMSDLGRDVVAGLPLDKVYVAIDPTVVSMSGLAIAAHKNIYYTAASRAMTYLMRPVGKEEWVSQSSEVGLDSISDISTNEEVYKKEIQAKKQRRADIIKGLSYYDGKDIQKKVEHVKEAEYVKDKPKSTTQKKETTEKKKFEKSVTAQVLQDANYNVGRDSFTSKYSAIVHANNSDANILPIDYAATEWSSDQSSVTEEDYFNLNKNKALAEKALLLNTLQGKELQLSYANNIVLAKRNDNGTYIPETFKDVIVLRDDNGTFLGVLPKDKAKAELVGLSEQEKNLQRAIRDVWEKGKQIAIEGQDETRIGTAYLHTADSTAANYRWYKEKKRSLATFMEDMESRGFEIADRVMRKATGTSNPLLAVRVKGSNLSPTWVEVHNRKMTPSDIDNLKGTVEGITDKDALENTQAYKALQQNKSIIAPDGKLLDRFAPYVTVNNSNNKTFINVKDNIALTAALTELGKGTSFYPYVSQKGEKYLEVPINNISADTFTVDGDVHMPLTFFNIAVDDVKIEENEDLIPFYKTPQRIMEEGDSKVMKQSATDMTTYLLGDKYVQGKWEFQIEANKGVQSGLRFKNKIGEDVLGFTSEAYIALKEFEDETVSKFAAIHEPVHVVIRTMPDVERTWVMKNARQLMNNPNASDFDVREYIARDFMTKEIKPVKGITKIWKNFVSWLKDVSYRWRPYKYNLKNFFTKFETGYYNNRLQNYSSGFETENYTPDQQVKYSKLISMFGGKDPANRMLTFVVNHIIRSSSMHNSWNAPATDIMEAIRVGGREKLLNSLSRVDELYANHPDYELIKRGLEVSTDPDNYKAIIQHLFPKMNTHDAVMDDEMDKDGAYSDDVAVQDVMTTLTKFVRDTIPYMDGKKQVGFCKKETVDQIMRDVVLDLHLVNLERGGGDVSNMIQILEKHKRRLKDADPVTTNTYNSILQHFFRNTIDKNKYGYYDITINRNQYLNTKQLPQETIRAKTKMAEDILSAFVSFYKSLDTEHTLLEVDGKIKQYMETSEMDFISQWKGSIYNNFFKGNIVKDVVKKIFDPEDRTRGPRGFIDIQPIVGGIEMSFKGLPSSIEYKDNKFNVAIRNSDEEIIQPTANGDNTEYIREFSNFLTSLDSAFMIGLEPKARMYLITQSLEALREVNTEKAADYVNISDIGTMFGTIAMVLRTQVSLPALDSILATIKNILVKEKTLPTKDDIDVNVLFDQTDAFKNVAKSIAKYKTFFSAKFSIDATGNNVPTERFVTFLKKIFVNGRSNGVVRSFKDMVKQQIAKTEVTGDIYPQTQNIYYDPKNDEVLDGLLDGTMQVRNVYLNLGGERKRTKKMTLAQLYNNTELNFRESVFNSRKETVLRVIPDSHANSGTSYNFDVFFGKGVVKYTVDDKGVPKLYIEWNKLDEQLTKKFKSADRAQKASMARWYNALPGQEEGAIKRASLAETLANTSLQDKLLINIKRHLDVTDRVALLNSGLAENMDFIIEGDKAVPGKALMLDDDIYNRDNYNAWMRQGTDKRELFHKMFWSRYENMIDMITSFRKDKVIMPDEVRAIMPSYYQANKDGDGNVKFTWHPYYELMLYSQHLFSDSVNNVVSWSKWQHGDVNKTSSRTKADNTNGISLVVGETWSVPEVMKYSKYIDVPVEVPYLSKLLGKPFLVNATDGQSNSLPLYANVFSRSLGGQLGLFQPTHTNIKYIAKQNPITGPATMQKFQVAIKNQSDVNTSFMDDQGRNAVEESYRFMLRAGNPNGTQVHVNKDMARDINYHLDHNVKEGDNITIELDKFYDMLQAKYNNVQKTFNTMYEFIADMRRYGVNLWDNIHIGINPESTEKMNQSNLNSYDPLRMGDVDPATILSDKVSMRHVAFQKKATAEMSDESKVASPSQLQTIIGLLPGEYNIKLQNAISTYIDNEIGNIQRDFNKGKIKGGKGYGRERAMFSTDKTSKNTAAMERIIDENISNNIPDISDAIRIALITYVNDVVNAKQQGLRVVLESDNLNSIWRYTDENGHVVEATTAEITKLGLSETRRATQPSDDTNIPAEGEVVISEATDTSTDVSQDILNMIRLYDYQGNEITEASGIGKATIVKPAEVMMSTSFFDSFGISKEDTLNDVLTLKLIDEEGNKKSLNIRAYIKAVLGVNYYNPDNRNAFLVNLEDHIKQFLNEGEVKPDKYRDLTSIKQRTWVIDPECLVGIHGYKDIALAAKFYQAFIHTLFAISVHIPTVNIASASAVEVVAFMNDKNNAMVIARGNTGMKGTDFDIDEDTLGLPSVHMVEHTQSDNSTIMVPTLYGDTLNEPMSKNGLNNIKHDLLSKLFSDGKYAVFYLQEVLSTKVKKWIDKRKETRIDKAYNADFATSLIKTNDASIGDALIGVSMNITNAVAKAVGTIHTENMLIKDNPDVKRTFNLFGNDVPSRSLALLDTLMARSQLIVDNTKTGGVGILGLTPTMLKVTAIMAGRGKTEEEVQEFFDNKVIQRIINKIGDGGTFDRYNTEAYNTITKAIRILEVKDMVSDSDYSKKVYDAIQAKIDHYKQRIKDVGQGIVTDESVDEWDKTLPDYEPSDDITKEEALAIAKSKDKIKYFEKAINKLEKKIVNLNDEVVKQLENRKNTIDKLNELYSYFMDTYILDRVSFFTTKNKGFDIDQFKFTKILSEFKHIVGTSINNFFTGKYVKQDNLDKIKHLEGYVSIEEDFSNDDKMFDYTLSFMNGLEEGLKANGLLDKVHIHTAGNVGFSDHIANQAYARDMQATYYVPENGVIKDENGFGIKVETMNERPVTALPDTKTNLDVAKEIKKLYDKDGDLFISAGIQPNPLSEFMTDRQTIRPVRGNGNTKGLELAADILRKYELKETKNYVEGRKKGVAEIHLNLFGADMFTLLTREKSPYEVARTIETYIPTKFNAESFIKLNKDMYAGFNALKVLNNILSDNKQGLIPFSNTVEAIMDAIKINQKIPELTEKQYYSILNSVNGMILFNYFNEGKTDVPYRTSLSDNTETWNLKDYSDQLSFVDALPDLIMSIKTLDTSQLNENIKGIFEGMNKNLIIQELLTISDQLQFSSTFNIDQDNIHIYQKAFSELRNLSNELVKEPGFGDMNVAEMLAYYTFLRYGYKFRKGTLKDVTGNNELYDISSYIDDNATDILKNMFVDVDKNKFGIAILNIIANDPDIFSRDYSDKRNTKLLTRRTEKVIGKDMRKNIPYYEMLGPNGVINKVYMSGSKSTYTIPTTQAQVYTVPTIRVRDNMRMSELKLGQTTLNYVNGSRYLHSQPYIVNDKYVVTVVNNTENGKYVTIRLDNTTPLNSFIPSVQANIAQYNIDAMKQIVNYIDTNSGNDTYGIEVDWMNLRTLDKSMVTKSGNMNKLLVSANSTWIANNISSLGKLNAYLLSRYKPEAFNRILPQLGMINTKGTTSGVMDKISFLYQTIDSSFAMDEALLNDLNSVTEVYEKIFDTKDISLQSTILGIINSKLNDIIEPC